MNTLFIQLREIQLSFYMTPQIGRSLRKFEKKSIRFYFHNFSKLVEILIQFYTVFKITKNRVGKKYFWTNFEGIFQ